MLLPYDAIRPIVAFVDLAGGRADPSLRRVRARSAIVVLGGDDLGRVFVLEAWAQRVSTDQLIERIYETQARWQPKVIGIEANAMQSLFVDAIQRDARLQQRSLPAVPVYQPTKLDKLFRIRMRLQPLIAYGKMFVPEEFTELRREIQNFPMHPTKDLIDALASATTLLPNRRAHHEHEEALAVAKYLRDTNAPAWAVKQVLHDVGMDR